jgi:hypothetical protein
MQTATKTYDQGNIPLTTAHDASHTIHVAYASDTTKVTSHERRPYVSHTTKATSHERQPHVAYAIYTTKATSQERRPIEGPNNLHIVENDSSTT